MANSLRAKISKLRHDRNIIEEEYQEIISHLDIHVNQIRAEAIDDFVDALEKLNKKRKGIGIDMIDVFEVAEQLKEQNK